jgi:hypothetical protein
LERKLGTLSNLWQWKNHLPKIPNENNSLWHSKVNDVEKVAYCYKQVSTLQQKMAKLGNCAVLVTFMCLD